MESDYMDEERLTIDQFLFGKVTKGEFGWLAGIIDADGGFNINVTWKSNGDVRCFNPVTHVTNTNPSIFHKIHAMGIGARPVPNKRRMKVDGSGLRKQSYRLSLYARDMRIMVPKIINELVAKRPQAHAMLKALDLIKTPKSEKRDIAIIELRGEIMLLNQKEWPLEEWS